MTGDVLLRQEVEASPLSGGDGLGERGGQQGRATESCPRDGEVVRPRHRSRMAGLSAVNGHGNARSIVRIQTLLANHGTAFGKTLMSPAGCMAVMEEQTNGMDLVLGVPVRFGLGYGLPGEMDPPTPNENVCFWDGYGGSMVVCDLDARVAFSYVMSRMDAGVHGDERGAGLWRAVYESLG